MSSSSLPKAEAGFDAPLAEFDRVAAAMVAAAGPLRMAVASTPVELEAVFALRAGCVVERGWARADEIPGGLERDVHDDRSVQLAAWDADELVGTARLVLPGHGLRLPVEEAYEITVEPVGHVVEGGRMVVRADHRHDPQRRVACGLFGIAWTQTRFHGFQLHAGTASERMIELMRVSGFEVEVLGPPRRYWGEDRFPIRMGPGSRTGPAWTA